MGSKAIEDIFSNSERYLNMIQDENKIIRRNAIKIINSQFHEHINSNQISSVDKVLSSVKDDSSGNAENVETNQVFLAFLRPVAVLIKDPEDSTREASYEILGLLVRKLQKSHIKEILPTLIPIMVNRFGQPELNEPSEEVRLLGITHIHDLLKKLGSEMNPFIDDILQILANSITDPYHKIRVLGCEVSCAVSDICRSVFHYNSDRLLKPLQVSITHRHFRVRVASVKCIHQVVLLGNHKGIEQILPCLTQRLFDSISDVRLAVTEAVGAWITGYVDRYSYFYRFLPLLMTLQNDDDPSVQNRARQLWDTAGLKYLDENADKYREEIDFESPQPKHYPIGTIRPNLGCRLITWSCVCNLIPGIDNEVSDWVLSTRIKAVQLLYHVVLNSEEKITMHVSKIFPIIYKTIRDEEAQVTRWGELSAQTIGYFVPLRLTWPILSSTLSTGINEPNLRVLKAVLSGTAPEVLRPYAAEIVAFLVDPDILETRNKPRLLALIGICNALVDIVPEEMLKDTLSNMFTIIVTVWAEGQDLDVGQAASDVLSKLALVRECTVNELMGDLMGDILHKIKKNSSEWTPVSTDRLIFDFVLSQGGLAVDNNIDVILEIMLENVNPEKDPDVRLKFLTRLATHLVQYNKTTTADQQKLQIFVKQIIEDVLDPNLIWKAGKAADVIRTAAVSCLLAILDSDILDCEILGSMAPKMTMSLLGVVEDSTELTRIIACNCLDSMIVRGRRVIPIEILHKIYPKMLKRLDDVSNTVRLIALDVIKSVFTNLPINYDLNFYKGYMEHAYTVLILHLDDNDEEIQDKVQGVLSEIGKLRADCLVDLLEKSKMNHRTPKRCDEVIDKMKQLTVTESCE